MKKCNMWSMLHQTRMARAPSPDGTTAQRVERVKEDVRASTCKRETAIHDLRVCSAKRHPSHAGKCPLRRTSPPKHARENPHPHNRKNKEKAKKITTHPRNNRPLPPHPRSVEPGLRASLRAQCRDARDVVLRLMRVAVAGGDNRGRGGAGGGAGPCEERRPKRREKEQGRVGIGGRKSGAHGGQMRRSRVKEQAQRTRSPRTPLTFRYAENCARKRGALESCVAHRKWKKVAVVQAREGESGAARIKREVGGRRDGREARRAAPADRAHQSSPGYARTPSIKGMPLTRIRRTQHSKSRNALKVRGGTIMSWARARIEVDERWNVKMREVGGTTRDNGDDERGEDDEGRDVGENGGEHRQ
ncbi:hypothetical protein C8R45DRAFT_923341 [Mycena sanguinolenta]|nr:hypothetical protein C8R45DRAFT_923341 [Mycena sanguinolenta]